MLVAVEVAVHWTMFQVVMEALVEEVLVLFTERGQTRLEQQTLAAAEAAVLAGSITKVRTVVRES